MLEVDYWKKRLASCITDNSKLLTFRAFIIGSSIFLTIASTLESCAYEAFNKIGFPLQLFTFPLSSNVTFKCPKYFP